jgi:alpha-tubulin suppressor-like RCC1 family protein
MFGHVFHVTMKSDFLLLFLEEDGKVFCWGWNKYGQVLMLNPNQSSYLASIWNGIGF